MKTMKFKGSTKLLNALLLLFGFSLCECTKMYGSSPADFIDLKVNATIVNEENVLLEGISVGLKTYDEPNFYRTDKDGFVEILEKEYTMDSLRLDIRDTDGAVNGSYRDTVFRERIKATDYVKKSKESNGVVNMDVTVVLKAKEL